MGLSRVVIKTYKEDLNEEFTLPFLWKGPSYNKFNTGVGMKYFHNINIIPLPNLLHQYFNPFRVTMYFNAKTEEYCVELMW